MHVFDNKRNFKPTYDALIAMISQNTYDIKRIIASCENLDQITFSTALADSVCANWVHVANRIGERHSKSMTTHEEELAAFIGGVQQSLLDACNERVAEIQAAGSGDDTNPAPHILTDDEAAARYARSSFSVVGFHAPGHRATGKHTTKQHKKNERGKRTAD